MATAHSGCQQVEDVHDHWSSRVSPKGGWVSLRVGRRRLRIRSVELPRTRQSPLRDRRARPLIAEAVASQGVGADQLSLHADRGTSMTSKPVAALLADLGIARSHSRPHVSNDTPTARPPSRPSSTARRSLPSSGRSTTPEVSASSSSTTTTTTTATPRSPCIPRPRSTTGRPKPSRRPEPKPSTPPTGPTPDGSAGAAPAF